MKRYIVPLTIITIVFGLAHYFIFRTITRSIYNNDIFFYSLAGVMAIALIIMPLGFLISASKYKRKLKAITWFGYIWLGFFQIIFFFTLLETAASYFYSHEYSYWVLIASVLITIWALYKGLKAPVLIRHGIKGPASLKGLTLIQISDLHIGLLHLNAKWLSSVVRRINELKPDLMAITGDLVEGEFSEVSPMLEILRTVEVKIEKYYITGNHEYIHGSGPWEKRLRQLGYRTLHNENTLIKFNQASILIAGVPDRMAPRFDRNLESRPDLALHTNHKVDYKILLAHEPASVLDLRYEPCDLILSGHTHGGQIFPFGAVVRIVQPVVKGFKKMGQTLVFAHQGTGLWGPPMRWFTRSEIVLMTWE